MKTTSCNANVFLKNLNIQKYTPLEVTKGNYIGDSESLYGKIIKDYEANIELNGKTIGTFFTKWYFYYDDQFGMNDFYSRAVKDINYNQLKLEV